MAMIMSGPLERRRPALGRTRASASDEGVDTRVIQTRDRPRRPAIEDRSGNQIIDADRRRHVARQTESSMSLTGAGDRFWMAERSAAENTDRRAVITNQLVCGPALPALLDGAYGGQRLLCCQPPIDR